MEQSLPKGVYAHRNVFQVRHKNKYIGTFKTVKKAIAAHAKAVKADPIIRPEKIQQGREYVEYFINRNGDSYVVSVSGYLGSYKDLNVARMARNNEMRRLNIKAHLYVKGAEHIPDDLKKQPSSKKSAFDKIAAKEVKAKRKPLPHQNIVISPSSYTTKNKPALLPPTIEFKPEPVRPDLTGIERNDGIFFIKNTWLVFMTIGGVQNVFVAYSPEDGKQIQERGGVLKLKKGEA